MIKEIMRQLQSEMEGFPDDIENHIQTLLGHINDHNNDEGMNLESLIKYTQESRDSIDNSLNTFDIYLSRTQQIVNNIRQSIC